MLAVLKMLFIPSTFRIIYMFRFYPPKSLDGLSLQLTADFVELTFTCFERSS